MPYLFYLVKIFLQFLCLSETNPVFRNFDKVFVVICHSCLEPNPLSVILIHFWHVRTTNSITPVTLIYNFNIRISILSTQPRKHDNYNPRELAWLTFSWINLRFLILQSTKKILLRGEQSLYRGCISYSSFTGPKNALIWKGLIDRQINITHFVIFKRKLDFGMFRRRVCLNNSDWLPAWFCSKFDFSRTCRISLPWFGIVYFPTKSQANIS